MLDKSRQSDLWRSIEQMDRDEKRMLIAALHRSLQNEPGGALTSVSFKQVVEQMNRLRRGTRLGSDMTLQQLIEEGRRY